MIDIRCSAEAQTGEGRRCQLLLGHEGSHAYMFADSRGRAIETWDLNSARHLVRRDSSSAHEFPWAPTFPIAIDTVLTAETLAEDHVPAAAAQTRPTHKRAGLRSVPSAQSVA